ncbi:SDR family NAD(P)-dependent oxidoreductase [Sneathiella aquimaris]|uniref:SDR family NAD(P)-dependent oxidoreductase n=1 Tax=Sneathiella aquimaris TaxID=2599305 RepID=UPI00146A79B9|nr:SDR family NAD(P)-dependent oxidoreductase [Sneathiella aquimaris]
MADQNPSSLNCVVTGGSAGIGFATADHLLAEGHSVFICARTAANLENALKTLQDKHAKAVLHGAVCDIRRYEDVTKMMAEAASAMGQIDVLVNNAGVGKIASIIDLSIDDWQAMIDTNLTGVFNCSKAALPELMKSNNAHIINLGSRSGRYAFAGGTAYSATKSGIQGFTEALFLDLGQHSISVSLVAPGTVATEFADVEKQDWQIQPEDIALVIGNILNTPKRANINWVEIRPGLPR